MINFLSYIFISTGQNNYVVSFLHKYVCHAEWQQNII